MAYSESMARAIKKYEQEKVERIMFRVPKGKKTVIQEHAQRCGESVNGFLLRAVEETMQRDQQAEEKF